MTQQGGNIGLVQLFEVDIADFQTGDDAIFRAAHNLAESGEAVMKRADDRRGTDPENIAMPQIQQMRDRQPPGGHVINLHKIPGETVAAVETDAGNIKRLQAGDDRIIQQQAGKDDAVTLIAKCRRISHIHLRAVREMHIDAIARPVGKTHDLLRGIHKKRIMQRAGNKGNRAGTFLHQAASVGIGDIIKRLNGAQHLLACRLLHLVGIIEYPRYGGLRYTGFFGNVSGRRHDVARGNDAIIL